MGRPQINRGPILSPQINIGNRTGPQSAAPPASASQKRPAQPYTPPATQPTVTPAGWEKDMAELRRMVAELKLAVKDGAPGKDGAQGPPGPQGPAGKEGTVIYQADEKRIAALEAELVELRRLLAQRPTQPVAQPAKRVRVEEVE